MSEKKDPNEINFDDDFLDIDFDDDMPNENPAPPTDGQLPTSEPYSDITDGPTADSATLSDAHLSADVATGIDLSNIEANLPDDDFLNQLYNLQQNPTPNPELDTTNMSNAHVATGAGASITDTSASIKDAEKPTKKELGGLFDKKDTPKTPKPPKISKPTKSPKAPRPTKSSSGKGDLTGLLSNPKELNKLILGGVIALSLIGAALYMAMSSNESSTPDVASTSVSAPAPAEETAPPDTDSTESHTPQGEGDVSSDTAASPMADDSVLPNIKPVVSPDEILNAEIPTDPALIKEEIDRLADKDSQIAAQEKLIQDQLTMMEDLTTAKAEQIALLEAQIAELENQKNSTKHTDPTSGQ